jgi:hypothetical protein
VGLETLNLRVAQHEEEGLRGKGGSEGDKGLPGGEMNEGVVGVA